MRRCVLALAALLLALGAEPVAAAEPPRSGLVEVSDAAAGLAEPVPTEVAVTIDAAEAPPVDATVTDAAGTSAPAAESTPTSDPTTPPEPETATADGSDAVELSPEAASAVVDPGSTAPDPGASETEIDPSVLDPGTEGAGPPEQTAEPEAAASAQLDNPEADAEAVAPETESAPLSPPAASQSAAELAGSHPLAGSSESAGASEGTSSGAAPAGGAGLSELVERRAVGAVSRVEELPALTDTSAPGSELQAPSESTTALAAGDQGGPGCSDRRTDVGTSGSVAAVRFVKVRTARSDSGTSAPIQAATDSVSPPVTAAGGKSAKQSAPPVRQERLSVQKDKAPVLTRKRADLEPAARRTLSVGAEPNRPLWLLALVALMLAGLSLPLVLSGTRLWLRHQRAAPPPRPPQEPRAVPRREGGIRYRE